MADLQIFKNPDFGEIRIFKEPDGSITFCGVDATTALGYKDTVNALKQHCKEDGVVFHHIIDALGRTQKAKFISEGNLYRLIAGSRLPGADRFERWIFDEVLPSIRETGKYSVKGYAPKASSLGEVASFLKIMRSVMKENNQPPEKIAEMAEVVCEQFNVNIPDNFVRRNLFQMTLTQISFLTEN